MCGRRISRNSKHWYWSDGTRYLIRQWGGQVAGLPALC
ncbi:hypothetical protein [Dialister hominis]